MSDDRLTNLLQLQECHVRCSTIEGQLNDIPRDIMRLEMRMEQAREKIESLKQSIREMEVRRNELETDVAAANEQAARYKTQQLQVKKNEEYQALQHEIDETEGRIGRLEDEEIELMLAIDEKKEEAATETAAAESDIEQIRQNIALLRSREEAFKAELEGAREAVAEAEKDVEPGMLKQYQYVSSRVKKAPYVVPLQNQQCKGCFLRVSNDVETEARSAGIGRCDSCGRLVYFVK